MDGCRLDYCARRLDYYHCLIRPLGRATSDAHPNAKNNSLVTERFWGVPGWGEAEDMIRFLQISWRADRRRQIPELVTLGEGSPLRNRGGAT
jgi:hypothetical protein